MAFVKTTSHRSRRRLEQLADETPQWFYSWDREGHFAEIPDELVDAAVKIPGVSLSKRSDDLYLCISFQTGRMG